MDFPTFRTQYNAAIGRINSYDRAQLVAKVRHFYPTAATQSMDRFALRKLLTSKVDETKTRFFAQRKTANIPVVINKIFVPTIAEEAVLEIKANEVVVTLKPESELTNAQLNTIIDHFPNERVTVTGWGPIARKWHFESVDNAAGNFKTRLHNQLMAVFNQLVHMYEDEPYQMIRIARIPQAGGKLRRVGRMKFENCVVNAISLLSKKKDIKNMIYKKLPDLRPNEEHVWLNSEEEINAVAKAADICLNVYTELGANFSLTPWKTFGYTKREKINIKVSNEHAVIMAGKIKLSDVAYHEKLDMEVLKQTNVIDYDYEKTEDRNCPGDLEFYVSVNNGKATINKKYRPSSFTNNPADDMNPDFFRTVSHRQVFCKLFMTHFDIKPTNRDFLKPIKAAEMFIGRGLTQFVNGPVIEIDHIKSFVSWRNCSHYIGFPTNTMMSLAGSPRTDGSLLPAFVIVQDIIFTNEVLEKGFSMLVSKMVSVLTYPMYVYLLSHSTRINVIETIYSEMKDIDLVKFSTQFDHPDIKFIRNAAVGNTIAGGIREQKVRTWYNLTEEEARQIEFECVENNYEWKKEECNTAAGGVNEKLSTLTVRMPMKNNRAAFHFHSYVLSYSAIQMLTKYLEVAAQGAKLVAFNVDSLTVDASTYLPISELTNDNFIGGFTYALHETLKPHYTRIKELTEGCSVTTYAENPHKLNSPNHDLRPSKRILITGAGGIGKTYPFLTRPFPGQTVTVPSLVLKENHKKRFDNVMTNQKYHGLSLEDAARKIHVKPSSMVISDEFTLLNESQWKKIIRVNEEDNSVLIVLGDPCQVRNEIRGDAVTLEFFINNGFSVVNAERIEGVPARHSYNYGRFLDTFRGHSNNIQKEMAISSGEFETMTETSIENIFHEECRVITGNHNRAHELNMMAKVRLPKIPMKIVNKCKSKGDIVMMPIDTPNVWWERTTYDQAAPKGTKYEPAFATTIDCLQGQTMENEILVHDMAHLTRHGTFYTAITRAKIAGQNILLI